MDAFQQYRRSIGFPILFWALIDLALNLLGLGLSRLLTPEDQYFPADVPFHLSQAGIQVLAFSGSFVLCYFLTKRWRFSIYFFTVIQIIIFHVIFFKNLTIEAGELQFVADFPSWELTYLQITAQDLVDVVSVFSPMTGIFDDGFFIPNSLFRFYSVEIFLTLLYYFLLSWVTIKISDKVIAARSAL